jgi:hypothetical protein
MAAIQFRGLIEMGLAKPVRSFIGIINGRAVKNEPIDPLRMAGCKSPCNQGACVVPQDINAVHIQTV